MAKASKREQWGRRLAAFKRSGLSRRAWCAAHGVKVHTLDYWRYRLRDRPAPRRRRRSKALVPIVVRESKAPAPTAEATIELTLPSGIRLSAAEGADLVWLSALVRELRAC